MFDLKLRFKTIWIASVLCLLLACSKPFQTGDGNKTTIEIPKNTKAMVYIFLVPDCPFSQYYSQAVNQVYSVFHQKGFQFYGIVPGNLYALHEMDSFKIQNKFGPEILMDKTYRLSKKFGVLVVPQVVVTDIKGQILYSGKIDDQAIAPGQKKQQPREFYLHNALKSIDSKMNIAIKRTEAVGCFIE